MKSTLASARRALKSLGPRGRTTRIPDSVRVAVLAYAREAHDGGERWDEIAQNVGLSVTALHRWNRGGQKKFRQTSLVPVVMSTPAVARVPAQAPITFTLTTVGGERIDGLELADAVRLVRALR
jgi:hypothetical protein